MGCFKNKVIDVAIGEIGYVEKKSKTNLDDAAANAGTKNMTKYARDLDAEKGFYNGKKQGFDWCDVFVDWCFVKAYGVDDALRLLCQPKKSLGAGCGYSRKYYKKKNRLFEEPEPGDQIFFYNSGKTGIGHTGIVVAVNGNIIDTVEGNTSNNRVERKQYSTSYKYIAGYGRPAYDVPDTLIDVGDEVNFVGSKQYTNANKLSLLYKKAKPCKAVVKQIYRLGKSKHPYLIKGSGVYGWVDEDTIERRS